MTNNNPYKEIIAVKTKEQANEMIKTLKKEGKEAKKRFICRKLNYDGSFIASFYTIWARDKEN